MLNKKLPLTMVLEVEHLGIKLMKNIQKGYQVYKNADERN